jgi:hypothetical protein
MIEETTIVYTFNCAAVVWCAGVLGLVSLSHIALATYDTYERLYLDTIQHHNYCTCQTMNTRKCNTWKQIETLDAGMRDTNTKIEGYDKWLKRLTCRRQTHM